MGSATVPCATGHRMRAMGARSDTQNPSQSAAARAHRKGFGPSCKTPSGPPATTCCKKSHAPQPRPLLDPTLAMQRTPSLRPHHHNCFTPGHASSATLHTTSASNNADVQLACKPSSVARRILLALWAPLEAPLTGITEAETSLHGRVHGRGEADAAHIHGVSRG